MKIDRSWRIGCETGEQANEVWRVLKDAGEPMFRNKGCYSGSGFQVFGFMHVGCWGVWDNSANITFKEFMKLMKVEDKKEDVQYVNNLLDYLDKPKLIQHIDGTHVRALHHFPDAHHNSQVVVVFENGITGSFQSNGKCLSSEATSSFILKPKEKKIARGWTRKIIYKNGVIFTPDVRPTKEDFMKVWHKRNLMQGYGPWEEVAVEVSDD